MNNIIPDLFEPLIRMSVTGSVLILLLLLLRNKLNAKWNYYVNIIVVVFMILPLNTDVLFGNITLPSFNLVNLFENKLTVKNIKDSTNPVYNNMPIKENTEISKYTSYEILPEFQSEAQGYSTAEKSESKPRVNYKHIISFMYLSGLLIFLLKKILGYIKFKKFLKNSSINFEDEYILSLYEKCAAELSIKRKVKFYANNNINSPMIFGLFKPAVYLPDLTLEGDEMCLILKHELIHFKRNDLWYKFAVSLVRAIHWFNPLCILFERNVDILCELSCDELVIENMNRQERKTYCKTVINTMSQLADRKTKPTGVYVAINSSRAQMERRFTHMLNYKKNSIINIIISCLLVGAVITIAVFASALNSPKNNSPANYLVTLPEEMGNISSIYSNSMVTGAIDIQGKVYIWGNNTYGQCDVPADLPPIKDLGIGAHCVIALDIDGKLHGWGTSEYHAMDFIENTGTFIDVDANSYHTAAVSSDGKVYKWGETNNGGQEFVPQNLPSVVSIQCGTYITTAIDVNGKVHIWGITSHKTFPDVLFKDVKAKMAAVLSYDTVVLGKDGKLYGEVPHKNFNNKYKEQPQIENIKAIYGGMVNAAAIDDNGKVYIWGEYDYNQGATSIIDVPENLPPIVQVVLGYNCATALGEDGKIYQWGGNMGYEAIKIINVDDLDSLINDIYSAQYSGSADVYTIEELLDAVQNKVKDINVKADISIQNEEFNIQNGQTLHIDENVVLSVHIMNLSISAGGDLINNGIIKVFGRIRFDKEPTKLGDTSGSTGEIQYDSNKLTLSEVRQILDEDLPYNTISSLSWEEYTFIIDEDYTLEKGKTIWLNSYTTLKVAEGVTLTIEGNFEVVNKPIIEGTVVGTINILK